MLAPESIRVEPLACSLGQTPPQAVVGRVSAVGKGVPDPQRWLDRLLVLPALRACAACVACRRGHAALCARQEPTTARALPFDVPARLGVPLARSGTAAPGELLEPEEPLALAALGDVGLLAYAALIRASVEPNRAAIVIGRGALARFTSALVEHRGARAIRVPVPDAQSAAAIEGALAEHDLEPFGTPLVCASDRAADRAAALGLARPGSAVVLCGAAGAAPPVALDRVVDRELSVFGITGAHPDLLPELVAFAAKGRLELAPLCRFVGEAEALAHGSRPVQDPEERVLIWRHDIR